LEGAPFKKKKTAGYRLPGDAAGAKPHHVEILGDGQQFVAYNIHPDTQQPYSWTGGDPTQILHGWLPLLSATDADEIIRQCEQVLAKYGTPVGPAPSAARIVDPLAAAIRKAGDTWFEPLSEEQKESEVSAIAGTWTAEQATDRDSWFICIRSIADAVDRGLDREAGINIAEKFSACSTGTIDTRDAVEAKMFEGGSKSSIYAAAATARKFGYKLPPDRAPLPPATTPPVAIDGYLTLEDRTDKGNANLMIRLAGGNLRYIPETNQWIRWNGQRWEIDEYETFVMTYALEVARVYLHKSQKLWEEVDALKAKGGTEHPDIQKIVVAAVKRAQAMTKYAEKCRNLTGLNAMVIAARKTEDVPLSAKMLDRKRHLLGVQNGVVNLKTRELIVNESRDDYITKRCPVSYKPNGPISKRFKLLIEEVTGSPLPVEHDAAGCIVAASVGRYTPRLELAVYLLRTLGYAITGEVREQTFDRRQL
jgi:hypothetical protein